MKVVVGGGRDSRCGAPGAILESARRAHFQCVGDVGRTARNERRQFAARSRALLKSRPQLIGGGEFATSPRELA